MRGQAEGEILLKELKKMRAMKKLIMAMTILFMKITLMKRITISNSHPGDYKSRDVFQNSVVSACIRDNIDLYLTRNKNSGDFN